MNELALFAGAGGGILGGLLLGWTTVCAVEINEYCRRVLLARQRDGCLPPFPIWDDVRTFDGKPWRGRVDVISGGFPCQDISCAGKGAGITGKRSGLWTEFSRIIGEIQPAFAFVENSPTLTSRGLGVVLEDLAEMGYDAAWGVVSAEDAIWLEGPAPVSHLRARIWILATRADAGCQHGDRRPDRKRPDWHEAKRDQETDQHQYVCEIRESPDATSFRRDTVRRTTAQQCENADSGSQTTSGAILGGGAQGNAGHPGEFCEGPDAPRPGAGPAQLSGQGHGSLAVRSGSDPALGGLTMHGEPQRNAGHPDEFCEGPDAESCHAEHHAPEQAGGTTAELGDIRPSSDAARQQGHQRDGRGVADTQERGQGSHAAAGPSRSGWWSTEPHVGGISDGLAIALDLHGAAAAGNVERVAKGVRNRVARLTAIGNGQVPQAAALAWRILMEELEEERNTNEMLM